MLFVFWFKIVGMFQVSCPSLQGRYLASNVLTRTLTLSATFATPAHCKQIDRWPRAPQVRHVCPPQSFSLLKASGVTMRASWVAVLQASMKSMWSQNVTRYQNIKQQHEYLKCNHPLAGTHLQNCLPIFSPSWLSLSLSLCIPISALFLPISVSISPYVLVGTHIDPTWLFQPPLHTAKEQAKTYQGGEPGQEILQFLMVFWRFPTKVRWCIFSTAKKICHSKRQLLFCKMWQTKHWNWSLVERWR